MHSRLFAVPKDPVLSLAVQARMTTPKVEEHRQFIVLVHHFLERFFNNDMAASDGEAKSRMIQIACTIGLPGFIMALYLYPAYHLPRGTRPYWSQAGDHFFYVMYSLVAMGIITIFEWDLFFPDLLDVFVLTSLPVENRRLFRARIAAIAIFIAGFLFDSNFLAPLVLPAATDPPNLIRLLMAHLVAVSMSGIFAAALFLALQGLLLAALGEYLFRRISLWLQGISVAALLTILFLYPVLFGTLNALLHAKTKVVLCLPPFWFLGIYQRLLEGPSVLPVFALLAKIGCAATLLAMSLAIFFYPFAYWRRTRGLVEGAAARLSKRRLSVSFNLLRRPVGRAIWQFIGQTLPRVSRYRMYLVMYGGLGSALILASVLRVNAADGSVRINLSDAGLRATIPIVAFWTVSGLRTVFLSPADQRGTWIFRVIQGKPGAEPLTAARSWVFLWAMILTMGAAALVCVIVPGAVAPGNGWRFAAGQILVATGLSLLLTDVFFLNVRTLPFTGQRPASAQNLALVLIRHYGFFPPLVLFTIAAEPWIEAGMWHLAVTALAVAMAHLCMEKIYRRSIAQHVALTGLDENEEEFPLRLGLRY